MPALVLRLVRGALRDVLGLVGGLGAERVLELRRALRRGVRDRCRRGGKRPRHQHLPQRAAASDGVLRLVGDALGGVAGGLLHLFCRLCHVSLLPSSSVFARPRSRSRSVRVSRRDRLAGGLRGRGRCVAGRALDDLGAVAVPSAGGEKLHHCVGIDRAGRCGRGCAADVARRSDRRVLRSVELVGPHDPRERGPRPDGGTRRTSDRGTLQHRLHDVVATRLLLLVASLLFLLRPRILFGGVVLSRFRFSRQLWAPLSIAVSKSGRHDRHD